MKSDFLLLAWGYIIEVFLAVLVYVVLILFVGRQELLNMIHDKWGVFLTVALAFFIFGFSQLHQYSKESETEFGKYLLWRGAYNKFYNAYLYQVYLYFCAFVISLVVAFIQNNFWSDIAYVIIIILIINILTTVRNKSGLDRLHRLFKSLNDVADSEFYDKHS